MKRTTIITQLVIFVAIVIVINMISGKAFFRLDFTADQQYTLSDATKDILEELDDVITITAYYTEELPPQLVKSRKDFVDMLTEYETRSGGNIVYEFINPNENEEKEAEAQQKGISPLMVNVTEKDQVKQMRAYMGAVLQMGEKTEIIPLVQPGAGMEFALTTAIKKISLLDKPKLGFLQGHGEPSINANMQLMQQLSVLYEAEPVTITDTSEIPMYIKTLIIIDPKDTMPQSHLGKIDRYLNAGGSVYLAYSSLSSDLSSQYLQPKNDIGLKGWLSKKGITMHDNYVIDATCGAISVRQQLGPFPVQRQIQFPYFPVISNFSEHPAGQGIESLMLPFAASFSYSPVDSAVNIQPIAFSSEKSGVVNAPTMIDVQKQWTENDFKDPNQVVALAAEGPVAGSGDAKLVVVANGSYATNGESQPGQQPQQVNPDNVNFASNVIDWLSDDTGLIDLRTKGVTNRPLEQIEDTEKAIYKYGNAFAPIVLIIIFALYRRQRYQKKKQMWMQGNY